MSDKQLGINNSSVFSDLRIFRAIINSIAESTDNQQTKLEAQNIDNYLVERITQLQKAEQESKAASQPSKQRKIYKNGAWQIV